MATPVLLLVLIYLVYAVIVFRQPKGATLEGPAIRGNTRIQTTWIVITSALVLSLAVYGTVRLLADNGAGSGSGPKPLTVPKGHKLQVQVIAQQWAFTYRYPDLRRRRDHAPRAAGQPDGRTARHLAGRDPLLLGLPARRQGRRQPRRRQRRCSSSRPRNETFEVHCSELCGIWHGYMFDHGHVVTAQAFETWIHQQQAATAPRPRRCCRRTHTPTHPNQRGARNEHTAAAPTQPRPPLAAPDRLQPPDRRDPRRRRLLPRLVHRPSDLVEQKLRIHLRDRRERHRAAARLLSSASSAS